MFDTSTNTLYRDVSDIEAYYPAYNFDAWCYGDNQTIFTYKDDGTGGGVGYLGTWKLISNKYKLIYQTTIAAPLPDTCINQETIQITKIPSTYDFVVPFYEIAAIICALAIFGFAYKLIIYPWYRKRVK